jgi:hypothetical protein
MALGSESAPFFGAAGGGATGYEIERSLRFNSADSAYLDRTPSSAGNRRTWTWAGWVKRTVKNTSTDQMLFTGGTTNSATGFLALDFNSSDKLRLSSATANLLITAAVYRDASAWMHIVLTFDSTQGANADKAKLYVNGSEVTTFDTDGRSGISNQDYGINQAAAHEIGRASLGSNKYLDGYLADIHFIDGQALDPTSFGEFDDNGVFQPIAYAGTYGTNGFHLDFSDNSSNAALGDDSSGNENDFTANNFTAAGSAWNQSQTWSNGTASGTAPFGSSAWAHVFDSVVPATFDHANLVYLTGSGTFTFPSAISGRIQVYAAQGSSTAFSNNSLELSDGSTINVTNGNASFTLYDFGTKSNITSITINGADVFSGVGVPAILLDGNMLVDPSVVDPEGPNIDVLFDTPTNGTQTDTGAGGEVSGNYATLNPLFKSGDISLSNGNLDYTTSTNSAHRLALSTFRLDSGKWYWEQTMNTAFTDAVPVGICRTPDSFNYYVGQFTGGSYGLHSNGDFYYNGTYDPSYNLPFGSGDVIGVAFDADAGTLTFYKNGVSGGQATSSATGGGFFPAVATFYSGQSASLNFGQRAFAYNAPSGYKALCTANLDDPTIADGSAYMDVALWTGNNTSGRSITGLGFNPDLVWIKSRSNSGSHAWFDALRSTNMLASNDTSAESSFGTPPVGGYVSAFNTDGFTLTNGSVNNTYVNEISYTYVGWTWDAGTSTVPNTDGSITSSVRANPSAGFSIVTYTGNLSSSGSETVGHGLGVAPGMVITKSRDSTGADTGDWAIQHSSLTSTHILRFDTAASSAKSGLTAPTSTVFTTTYTVGLNVTGNDYVAYCFTPVEGYSAFGSYTGNGNADGPFVYTGFEVKFLLAKRAVGGIGDWILQDTTRTPANGTGDNNTLVANVSNSEDGYYLPSQVGIDYLSNGFKLRHSGGPLNDSGSTYIYAAFAENPFKTARAR